MKKIQMISVENLSIAEGFEMFINDRVAKNYSDYTIKFYKNTIHNFSLFYELSNLIESLNKHVLNQYVIYLRQMNLSDATISTYIRGLRTILYYFMDEEFLPRFKIPLPKSEEKIKETYTKEELDSILKKPNLKKCTFAQYRNWVLVNYLLGTGQRLNTVINIKIQDVDLENSFVKLVKTKGRRETILPLSSVLTNILREYLRFRKGNDKDYLFSTITGTQMSKDGITSAIKDHNLRNGVKRHSIHLFRHTFAKYYLLNGGDVFRLQKLMCHKDLKTTRLYLSDLEMKDLSINYHDLNPLDSMIKSDKISMR